MKPFEKAKWIWCERDAKPDSYGEFYTKIFCNKKEKTVCYLSADSDYALFINGKYVASNQYSDFEYFKVYDELDITDYLCEGENHVAVLVWYIGVNTQKYLKAGAGLIFEIVRGEKVLLSSGENVLARKSRAYKNERQKRIGLQIGFSFYYDSTKEDDWKLGNGDGFIKAIPVKKNCTFVARPNEKLHLDEKVQPLSVKKWHSNLVVTVDLGKESVGLPMIAFDSPVEQKVVVTWSEGLSSGNIRRYMGGNEYSFEYMAKAGKNVYFNPFLRLGCRYIGIEAETEIQLSYLGILPFLYPLKEKEPLVLSEQDKKIYDLCVDTLRLCAFERPVDCPFREQGFYAYDARNQMLAGYYAFEEYKNYAKANLKFMSMDRRADGLLSITTPGECIVMIPTYSLYYVLSVWEYLQYSNENFLDACILEKIHVIMNIFTQRLDNGLISNYKGEEAGWNFYDWSEHLEGYNENRLYDGTPDLIINCLYILVYQAYEKICKRVGMECPLQTDVGYMRKRIQETFFNVEKGLFTMFIDTEKFTQLGNSFAILADVLSNTEAEKLCEKIRAGETTESSLAMKPFYYDALLRVDFEKYKADVLAEIRKNYTFMLENGATSVWETMEGDVGHNSLCHAWNSYPIYYFNILLK